MAPKTEHEDLRDALQTAIIETRKNLHQVRSQIAKLYVITNNRKLGDGYVSNEHILNVTIPAWEEHQREWERRLDALLKLVEREGLNDNVI